MLRLNAEAICKSYGTGDGRFTALDKVSLDVDAGEFVSIVGPSGCGKSTLMLIMSGLRQPTSGQVLIDGSPTNGPQTDLGIVFQRDALLPWRTVMDNVLLQADLRGVPRRQYAQRTMELLRSVGLGGFEHHLPDELSGGMRQRVSICRALIHRPSILMMDEPFGALDALTREQMMFDLQKLWLNQKPTVMFVTHNISEAVFLSDRVVVMSTRPGRIEKILPINLPRPRSLDASQSSEFNQLCGELRSIFESMGVIRHT
jgi:NitT/TauT family transport system ATP-binding protein